MAWALLAFLVLPAEATMCREPKGCAQPQAPLACMPGPEGAECPNLSPRDVERVFGEAMKKLEIERPPKIVVDPEHEFVSFDCASGKAVAGNSNAEANQCGDQHVVTVGRSVVDMSIRCQYGPLTIEPADTLEAWALHEGAHVKLKHVACLRLDIQRICVAWAGQDAGRRMVTQLLTKYRAASIDQLSQDALPRFRKDYVTECMRAKREEFEAGSREIEDKADEVAEKHAKPRALECALHGAIHYLKAIGQKADTAHNSPEQRVTDAEHRGAIRAYTPSVDPSTAFSAD